MKISLLHSHTDTAPRIVETDWGGIEALLGTSRRLGISSSEFFALDHAGRKPWKNGAAWIPGELVGPRFDENMKSIGVLVLDFDDMQARDVERLWVKLHGIRGLAHTSASHTEAKPKWRVAIPLARPIDALGWRERWRAAVAHLDLSGRLKPDAAAKNPSRLYYLPTNLADVEPNWHRLEGKPLDIDAIPVPKPYKRPAPTLAMAWWSDDFVRQARNYLRKMGPAIEGVHGDDKTYQAACVLIRDFALPESVAMDLFREWNAGCEPPWSDEDLRAKLQHALKYGTGPMGCRRDAFHHGGFDRAAVEALIWGKKGNA